CHLSDLRSFPPRRSSDLLGQHGDLGEADLRARRVREAQVLHVYPELADLGEESGKLAGGVIHLDDQPAEVARLPVLARNARDARSEEHTSELQSREKLVC